MNRVLMVLGLVSVCATTLADVPLIQKSTVSSVRIILYVGQPAAVVRETCTVMVPAGESDIRFRWADADIDAASVSLLGPDDVQIGGVRQPVGTTKTFSWLVQADQAGPRRFAASYRMKGITWTPSYRLTFDPVAKTASVRGSLHLTNGSKLPIRKAQLELAVPPTGVLDKLQEATTGVRPEPYAALTSCTLEPGWQRRFTFIRARDLPARLLYRADPVARKQEVHRYLYVDMKGLPVPGALPSGHLEVYEVLDGVRHWLLSGTLSHSISAETQVGLGRELDILFERKILARHKTDVEFDTIGRVSGYDTSEQVLDVVRNRLPILASIELTEPVSGKWEITAEPAPTSRDSAKAVWVFDLEPNARQELAFTVLRHIGSRAD